jgi:hypothetical protein
MTKQTLIDEWATSTAEERFSDLFVPWIVADNAAQDGAIFGVADVFLDASLNLDDVFTFHVGNTPAADEPRLQMAIFPAVFDEDAPDLAVSIGEAILRLSHDLLQLWELRREAEEAEAEFEEESETWEPEEQSLLEILEEKVEAAEDVLADAWDAVKDFLEDEPLIDAINDAYSATGQYVQNLLQMAADAES